MIKYYKYLDRLLLITFVNDEYLIITEMSIVSVNLTDNFIFIWFFEDISFNPF